MLETLLLHLLRSLSQEWAIMLLVRRCRRWPRTSRCGEGLVGPAVADEADSGLKSPATGRTEVCCLDCCRRICWSLLLDLSLFLRLLHPLLVALWIVHRQADRCCASVCQVGGFRCVCFKDALRVSLYLFFWLPRLGFASSPKKRHLEIRSSSILATWPAHLRWVFFKSACMLAC